MAEGEGKGWEGGGVKTAFVLAMALTAATPAPTAAQRVQPVQAGSIKTAQAIVARQQQEQLLDTMFQQLMPLMVANVQNAIQNDATTPAALKERLKTDAGRKQVGSIIGEEFTSAFRQRYADIGEATAEEYSKLFSEPELVAILAFYSSPAGMKMLRLQPQLQKTLSEQGRALGREAGMAAVPKIQARLTALNAPATK